MMKTASIEVIGGADGPTTVFVAGKLGTGTIAGIVVIGIVLITAGILIYKWKKK